jgi:hypothetical protein
VVPRQGVAGLIMSTQITTLCEAAGPLGGRSPRNLYDQKFGALEVLYRARDPKGNRGWLCRCSECGGETVHSAGDLTSGRTRCTICHPRRNGRPPLPAEERLRRELAKKCNGRPSRDPNVQARRECEWRWEQAAKAYLAGQQVAA